MKRGSGSVLQIVPRMSIGGVMAFSRILGTELKNRYGISPVYVEPEITGTQVIDDTVETCAVSAKYLSHKIAQFERSINDISGVILHYVGYGYQKRGVPFWLVHALEKWKKNSNLPLLVIFHEIFATGPIWRSSFWLSPVQKLLARRLICIADSMITSTEIWKRRLIELENDCSNRVEVLPVFSAIGETITHPSWGHRAAKMIVFGTPGQRIKVYQSDIEQLIQACRQLECDEVLDIGASIDADPASSSIPIRKLGILPDEEVSRVMLNARAGFVSYPKSLLAKSTLFAAYCAHGLVPFVASSPGTTSDGLHEGIHFVHAGDPFDPEMISAAAFQWYQHHNSSVHAGVVYRLLYSGLRAELSRKQI